MWIPQHCLFGKSKFDSFCFTKALTGVIGVLARQVLNKELEKNADEHEKESKMCFCLHCKQSGQEKGGGSEIFRVGFCWYNRLQYILQIFMLDHFKDKWLLEMGKAPQISQWKMEWMGWLSTIKVDTVMVGNCWEHGVTTMKYLKRPGIYKEKGRSLRSAWLTRGCTLRTRTNLYIVRAPKLLAT